MVTAKILNFTQSPIGNILVNVEYTLPDASKVINPYHAKYTNFIGSNAVEIQDFLRRQIEYQCERYLEQYMRDKLNDNVIATALNGLVDSEFSREKVVWKFTDLGEKVTEQLKDSNIKGTIIKKVSIDKNGTITEEIV